MYRSIETDTWSDPWFSELSAPAKLIFLYLVTNSHVDPSGCCEITLRVMAFETGLEQDALKKILPRLEPQIMWWQERNVFWVRNFLRRQSANTNPGNFRKAAARALKERPADVVAVVVAEYPELPMHADPSDTSAMHPNGSSSATIHEDPSPSIGMHPDASTMHADASRMDAETVSVTVTEQKQKREKRLPTVAPSLPLAAHRAMFAALSQSFGRPTAGVEHGRYEKAAKELVTAGALPDEIPRLVEAWGWINPGAPRVNSLAGQLTLLRKAEPRATNGTGRIAQNLRNLATMEGDDDAAASVFGRNGGAHDELQSGAVEGARPALPRRAG